MFARTNSVTISGGFLVYIISTQLRHFGWLVGTFLLPLLTVQVNTIHTRAALVLSVIPCLVCIYLRSQTIIHLKNDAGK